jgi:hypothetical protein
MPKIYYDAKGFPVYDASDGWKDQETFRAAALNDMARKQQDQQTTQEQQLNTPQQGTKLGVGVAQALPFLGGMAGAAIPGAGETGMSELVGAGLGTAGKDYLKNKFPGTFGSTQGGMAGVSDMVNDTLLGGIGGTATMGLKGAGALSEGVAKALMGSRVGKIAESLSGASLSKFQQEVGKMILRAGALTVKDPLSSPSSSSSQNPSGPSQ